MMENWQFNVKLESEKGDQFYLPCWVAVAKFKLYAIKSVTPRIADQAIFIVKPNENRLVLVVSDFF